MLSWLRRPRRHRPADPAPQPVPVPLPAPPEPPGPVELASTALGERLLRATQSDAAAVTELRFSELRSLAEYERHRAAMRSVLANRTAMERLLCSGPLPYAYPGLDPCTRSATTFLIDHQYGAFPDPDGLLIPNYRERLVSASTGLTSRQRAIAVAAARLVGGADPEQLAVYATEARGAFFDYLRGWAPRTIGSEFLGPGVERGAEIDGLRHEDVTKLTFSDGAFDLVVSNDVLEHVPDYRAGLREMFRVLRRGGAFLFTVPFRMDRYDNLERARMGASGIEHLLPPDYHGDPVRPGEGILCFHTFAWQIFDDLRLVGFSDAGAMLAWSYLHGIMGSNIMLFGRKAG